MHLAPLIRDLAVILGVAGLISLLFHRIRQPVVIGYIIAGIVIGPHTPPFQLVTDIPSIQTWAELGVVFLMFSLGLDFSFRRLASVGFSAGVTAGMEVLFLLPGGYLVGKAFGWSTMDSVFLGAMLSISSTTIIIKALDELKLKNHRFAELIFGALIVEDLIAVLLLVALGTLASGQSMSAIAILSAGLKFGLVVGGWFITGYFVVPRFMRYVGRTGSDEMLTILSLGLCLAMVVFANRFHYSTALGAFIMGSILAESPTLPRIERNMASLRDLFGAIFFVSIGMLIDPRVLWDHAGTVLIICIFTIVAKIFSTSLGALLSGQSLRNSVQVGFGLAQIGEFSFIIAQLGLSFKAISDFLYPIAVAVSLVTTLFTPFLIRISGPAAKAVEYALPTRVREVLVRYAAQAEARRAGRHTGREYLRPLIRWSINGLTASVIFVLIADWLTPILVEKFPIDPRVTPLVGWTVAIVASAPFVWAMLNPFRKEEVKNGVSGAAAFPALRIALTVLTLLWLGALSIEFFSSEYIILAMTVVLFLAFVFFYRRLEDSYHSLERQFLSTFKVKPGEPQVPFSHLAPWDIHLVRVEIHSNSKLVKKTVSETAFRTRYGVNIVAIQRGRISLVPPMPEEILLPKDELILLGTDEQVETVRKILEEPDITLDRGPREDTYELMQVRIDEHSAFSGKSIRESGIREKFDSIVVGVERRETRLINPDSGLELRPGDVLWIAGEKAKLDQLLPAIKVVLGQPVP